MEVVLFGLWFLFVGLIPIVFVFTLNSSLQTETEKSSLVIRSILSAVLYFSITAFSALMLFFVVIGPEPRPGQVFGFEHFALGLVVLLGYGVAGWGLCSAVAGESLSVTTFSREKEQVSLFS